MGKMKRTDIEVSELLGCLIDVVEDWLEEKGFLPKDFPNDDREGNSDEAIIFGADYDYFADNFAKVIGISRDYVDKPERFADRKIR